MTVNIRKQEPLLESSIPIVPLSQPCPIPFYFLELRYVWGSLISRKNMQTFE